LPEFPAELLLAPAQAICNIQPTASRHTRKQVNTFLRCLLPRLAVPNIRTGNASHVAERKPDPRPNRPDAADVLRDAVAIVRVLVTELEIGVSVAGLKLHPAPAGTPLQDRLIELVNEPCGVTVKVNVPGDPAVTLALPGLADTAKFAAFTVCVRAVEVLAVSLASPP
jgi:hypothetical protein